MSESELRAFLERIDNRGYPAYKELRGRRFAFRRFVLFFDHIQGDPFAAPSRLRVRVPQDLAGFPEDLFHSREREVALRDFLARAFACAAAEVSQRRGSGRGGTIGGERLGQEILERSAVLVEADFVEARLRLGLPAAGRRILGREAERMLCDDLPRVVADSLEFEAHDAREVERHVCAAEDAAALRDALPQHGLVAFVADGSLLPRQSGVDPRPLREGAVPFTSPASLRVGIDLPHAGRVQGMGIPAGVTLIAGGGFHGKSTLLSALERGVYSHVPGDGREQVVADATAVKIRAEDGRRVEGVDISPFIKDLPQGRSTGFFRSDNASGSTSQAANIVEALEVGCRLLLVDEDTSATNFMIRDHRMQELVPKEREPITPFIDRVRQLYDERGISTILVMGGSGDYFDVADTVIAMEEYQPRDATARAREIAERHATRRVAEGGAGLGPSQSRQVRPTSVETGDSRRGPKIKVRDGGRLTFGKQELDLSLVAQLVDEGQLHAIGEALRYARQHLLDGHRSLAEVLDRVQREIHHSGLDVLADSFPRGEFTEFRRFELAAAFNRLRSLAVEAGAAAGGR